jgi:2-methylcitrate dehydratase
MTESREKPESANTHSLSLDRRELLKMGIGTLVAQAAISPSAAAQEPAVPSATVKVFTGTGGQNDANRASGNGPIDDPTRQIGNYVSGFSESNLTDSAIEALGYVMLDSVGALIAGFESQPARICAKMARSIRSDELKSTVLGYGLTTSPDMAAFANTCMLRYQDINDLGPGGHDSDVIPGILAFAEALHATGTQTLVAIALGYELMAGLSGTGARGTGTWDSLFESTATALAVGKIMNLNEDQLANALSLALVPHMPLNVSHIGHLSMWKGCHSPEAIRCGVFAAWMAREGMTGPSRPFEAKDGLFDHIGPFKQLRLPAGSPDGKLVVERTGFKRFPAEGSLQSVGEVAPQLSKLCKVEDITAITAELPANGIEEIADPTKWYPQNKETADHSLPYVIARSILDGDLFLDSYTEKKLKDPAVRQLMDKITVQTRPDFTYMGQFRITVHTKGAGDLVKETAVHLTTPMNHEEMVAKFDRICALRSVHDKQRDQARETWMNLRSVRDIAEPMRALANFGKPLPL